MGRQNERVVLQESPDILRFADKNIRNEEDRLYPDDPELQKLVQSWGMWVNATCNYLAYLLVESSDSSVAFLFSLRQFIVTHYVPLNTVFGVDMNTTCFVSNVSMMKHLVFFWNKDDCRFLFWDLLCDFSVDLMWGSHTFETGFSRLGRPR